jgi:hypothetical protein
MISVGFSELQGAFRKHSQFVGNGNSPSNNLILFYAIECGLKSVYLRRRSLSSTDKIRDETLRKSHDLAKWVKELRLPAQIAGNSPSFCLNRDQSRFHVALAHQAWRYGALILNQDEQILVSWLSKIKEWIEEAI